MKYYLIILLFLLSATLLVTGFSFPDKYSEQLKELYLTHGHPAPFILPAASFSSYLAWPLSAAHTNKSAGEPPSTTEVLPYSLPEQMPAKWLKMGARVYEAEQKLAHYQLSLVKEWEEAKSLKLLTKSQHTEHFIRPNTGAVFGFCFLYRFGNYNQKLVGVSRSELLQGYIIPMMRYLYRIHKTGDLKASNGERWGDQWQSAHWAYALGKAAWLVWPDLPADVQAGVKKVIRFEAERFYQLPPPYQLKLDTKSEENAWNSQIFEAAMLLMPQDKDFTRWQELNKKWVLSAYIRPADLTSTAVVSGTPLKSFVGANIYDDFTLENHNIVHPDYMNSWVLSGQFAVDYALQQKPVPDYLFFNIPGIYENLKWFALPDAGQNYPSGQDWGIYRNPDWFFTHMLMAVFKRDPDAPELARRALDCLEKMQQRHPQGNVYSQNEFFFASSHSDLMLYLAHSWLAMHFADKTVDKYTQRKGIRYFESGKLIQNRTPTAIHSLSWGNTVMFQAIAYGTDRILDAYMGSGIGQITVRDDKKPLTTQLQDITLEPTKKGYNAVFSVQHGNKVIAYYTLQSLPQKMVVHEKLVAQDQFVSSAIQTGVFGILNNSDWIYEKGYRTLRTDNANEVQFSSLSGKTETFRATTLALDNRYNISFTQPNAGFYRSVAKVIRGRATDQLVLNAIMEEKQWQKGDIISDISYTIAVK